MVICGLMGVLGLYALVDGMVCVQVFCQFLEFDFSVFWHFAFVECFTVEFHPVEQLVFFWVMA